MKKTDDETEHAPFHLCPPIPISCPTNFKHSLASTLASNCSAPSCPGDLVLLDDGRPTLPLTGEDGDIGDGASAMTHADGVLRGIAAMSHRMW